MADTPGRVGFFVWLFGLGADVAARRAIDLRLERISKTAKQIREDHSLDELVDDIESIASNGREAMGVGDG